MPLLQTVTDGRNIIKLGSKLAGVAGLIISSIVGLHGGAVPALKVTAPGGVNLFQISSSGAIGVSSPVVFGNNGDCLKSGGSSGSLMTFGTCGSGGGFNSGQVLAIGNARYVSKAGDTMTGALTIKVTNGNNGTLGLEVENLLSGAVIRAQNTLSSSGNLVVEGSTSGSSLYIATSINGAGLTTCSAAGNAIQWVSATGRFGCTTITDTIYTAGQGLTLTSTSFKLNTTNTGSLSSYLTQSGSAVYAKNTLTSSGTLKVLGNMSGASLNVNNLKSCTNVQTSAGGALSCNSTVYLTSDLAYTAGQGLALVGSTSFKLNSTLTGSIVQVSQTLASSGTLIWENAASGAYLVVSRAFSGAGLTGCTGAAQALQWSSSTGRFSCASPTGTTYTAGQGLALVGTSFKINLAHSGSVIQASATLASSGTVIWENMASGAYLVVSRAMSGAGLTSCTGAAQALQWSSTTGRFGCASPTGTTYNAGQGLTLAAGVFKLTASHSGTIIQAANTLASSGTMIWETAASGSTLYAATSINGSGLTDCVGTNALRWAAATGRFSCAADATSGTAGQGLTLVGGSMKLNATLTGTTLKGWGTISGSTVHADLQLQSSGALIIQGNSRIKGNENVVGTLSGAALNIMNGSSYFLGSVVLGKSSITAGVKLEEVGIMSGSIIRAATTLTSSGGLVIEGTTTGATIWASNLSGTTLKYRYASPRDLILQVTGSGNSITTGSGKQFFGPIPKDMSGFKITDAIVSATGTGAKAAGGAGTCIQIRDAMKGNRKVFSTPACMGSQNLDSSSYGTAVVISVANSDVGYKDRLWIDANSGSSTAVKGVSVGLTFSAP